MRSTLDWIKSKIMKLVFAFLFADYAAFRGKNNGLVSG